MKNFVIGILTIYLLSIVIVYIADAEKQSYPNLKVSGYIQAQYTMDKDGVNDFQAKRVRGEWIDDWLRGVARYEAKQS